MDHLLSKETSSSALRGYGGGDGERLARTFAVFPGTRLRGLPIFENRELEIKENCNSYIEIIRAGAKPPSEREFLAKRIRAHDGCLGIRRRRRTRKTAISFGEPSTGFDPEISEWGNPPAFIGGHPGMNP